jgi:NADH-quinone oxidoreductase subunit G
MALGTDLGYSTVDDITTHIAATVPGFEHVTPAAVAGDGVLAGAPTDMALATPAAAPLPERNAYEFRLVVSRVLYDQAVGTAKSPSLAHLARPSQVHLHPLDLERVGTTDGRSVKLSGARTSVVFTAVADPSVLRGTAWVPFNQSGPDVGELIDCFAPVNDVRIETL